MFRGEYPTPEELYALEQWAHRERSKALAQLIVSGAEALKKLFVRAFALRGPSAESVCKQVAHHA